MARAYVGLGANLGDRAATLARAIDLDTRTGIDVIAVSAFRETDPVGYLDQPQFLNAAVALETSLARGSFSQRCSTSSASSAGSTRGRATALVRSTSICC